MLINRENTVEHFIEIFEWFEVRYDRSRRHGPSA